MSIRKTQRMMAWLLSAALIITQFSVPAYAQETITKGNLCEHHTEHIDCGFAVGVACTHTHDKTCGYVEATDEQPCTFVAESEASPAEATTPHEHDETCGFAEAVVGVDCTHQHTPDCGYTKGTPCTFTKEQCEICTPKDSGVPAIGVSSITVTALDTLAKNISQRVVKVGTTFEQLNLPTDLAASGYTVTTDTEVIDSGISSNVTTPATTPAAISIEGVTWELDPDKNVNKEYNPLLGTYCFTPALPEGYTLAEGVSLPEISVRVGGKARAATSSHNISASDLIISGNDGCSASNPHTVIGTSVGGKIVVGSGTHHITLNGVSIDVSSSSTDSVCAFELQGTAEVNLTLIGENTLKSGWQKAGLQAQAGTTLTISGTGKLNATAHTRAAGIGGGYYGTGGNITINGGTITANGGSNGAGIGGCYNSAGGKTTINGGTITANGGDYGAGIGGGNNGVGGDIIINGGTITANGGDYGAGIGGGSDGASGNITISSGTIMATGGAISDGAISGSAGRGGAGIGGGDGGACDNITIKGGTITATGGASGAGIGGKDGAKGTFSTGTNGNAFIVTGSISDQDGKNNSNWGGVIFEGNNGAVYGNPTLGTDAEIPTDKTLTIGSGKTLTIGTDVTLTNNGKITVENGGTLKNSGGIFNNIGKLNNNGTIPSKEDTNTKVSTVVLTVSESSATYGGKITLTATVTEKASTYKGRGIAPKTVIFYCDRKEIGKAVVAEDSGTKKVVLTDIELSGATWKLGAHSLTAKYFGGFQLLPSESAAVSLKVKIPDQAAPTVTFSFDGDNPNKLMGAETTMEYSLNGGTNWTDCTEDIKLTSGITAANDIKIRMKETDTHFVGAAKTIDITQGAAVSGVTATNCTTTNNNDGKLTGVTRAMEYKLSTDSDWTRGTGNAITALKSGSYSVRTKAAGTALSGDSSSYTIAQYSVAPTYGVSLTQKGTYTFAGATVRYDEQSPLTVTVSNTGNQATGNMAVALSGTNSGSFTLSKNAINSISQNGNDTFTIVPKTALAVGTYTAIVTVSGSNSISANFTVSFKVSSPAVTTHTITSSAGKGGTISPSGSVSVTNGENKTFTISANTNYSISSVTVDGANKGAISTYAFENVTSNHSIVAAFSYNDGGGGDTGGGSTGGGTITPPVTPAKPNPPTTAESDVSSKTDKNGNATANVPNKDITKAIEKAQQEAKKNGTKASGIAITLNVKIDKNTTSLTVNLSAASIDALIKAGVSQFTIKNALTTVTLDLATLKALAGGEVKCYSAFYRPLIFFISSKLKEGADQINMMHSPSNCFIQYLLVLS